jgi:dCMP deaminase
MTDRWDEYFMDMALRSAKMSKDPSTKVGAVIVRNRSILATGFNGFPVNIADDNRLNVREEKLDIVVHAEMNAVLFAARNGIAIAASTMYVAACDAAGAVAWGGPPCVRCLVECMQAGVIEYVSWPIKSVPSRWHASCYKAKALIDESGLKFREVPLP